MTRDVGEQLRAALAGADDDDTEAISRCLGIKWYTVERWRRWATPSDSVAEQAMSVLLARRSCAHVTPARCHACSEVFCPGFACGIRLGGADHPYQARCQAYCPRCVR